MTANPILLQKKIARVIKCFADKANISLDDALKTFYSSELCRLIHEGVSDLHCMSDEYLATELLDEIKRTSEEKDTAHELIEVDDE